MRLSRRAFLAAGLLGTVAVTTKRILLGGGGGPFADAAPLSVAELTTGDQAGYCWFNDVRALRVNGKLYFGNIDPAGNVECRALDESTGIVSAVAATYPAFQADDHDNPSFLRRDSDGHIMAFFTAHVGAVYKTVGTAADDVASLTLANTTNITGEVGGITDAAGYTYASAFQLLGEASDPIFLSFRYHNAPVAEFAFHAMSKSIDGGVNFTDLDGVANAHSLLVLVTYHRAVQNGDDRIDFAYSNHPDDAGDHGIYHAYYQGGNLYQTDGTLIGAPGDGGEIGGAYGVGDLTQVFDDAGGMAWIWDIAIDDAGEPVVAFVVYEPSYPTGPWSYKRAHRVAGAWVVDDVADAGGKFPTTSDLAHGGQYAGGIAIDRFNTERVYYSSDAGGGNHKIYEATTPNGGTTWPAVQISDGLDDAVRPIAVTGEPGQTRVLWEHGTYDDYFGNYAMDIAAWR